MNQRASLTPQGIVRAIGLLALQATLASVAVGAASAGTSDGEAPRVWTWNPPTGPASSHPSFIPLTTVYVTPTTLPGDRADKLADVVIERGLAEGEFAVLLLNYGRGTLAGNPLDAIDDPSVPSEVAGGTPWTANGVLELGAWTDAFIARLRERIETDGLPRPSRFHMDSELRRPALCYLPDVEACWGTAPLVLFDAMRRDPRWDTEPLRMNPVAGDPHQTMAEIYAAAGSPSFDPTSSRRDEANREWSRWWDGVTRESMDGAFAEVLYDRVEAAWPAVRCSEFAQSMRLDGDLEPDGTRRAFVDFECWNEGWMSSHWRGRGTLQAPTMYVYGETFIDSGRPFMDEQMRLHRGNLDACLHSFGGVDPSEITPWLCLPQRGLPYGDSPATTRAYTDDEFLRMIALLRGRGIEEFMLWPSGTDAIWLAAARAIDAAWGPHWTAIEILTGIGDSNPLETLATADRIPCVVTPDTGGIVIEATGMLTPRPSCLHRSETWLALEAGSTQPTILEVEVRRADGSWRTVESLELLTTYASPFWLGPLDLGDGIAADGTTRWRLRAGARSSIAIDLLQVVHRTRILGDLDDDGDVDGSDLGMWLSQAGTSCVAGNECNADLDGDGQVRGGDLGLLLSNWGPCS